jgi:hypothetical protein
MRVNRARLGRVLLTLAVLVGIAGVALAGNRAEAGRYLGLSGCLVSAALAMLLLAPKPATRTERRERAEASVTPMPVPYRVPRQRALTDGELPTRCATATEAGESQAA